jgi:hypothetical protein
VEASVFENWELRRIIADMQLPAEPALNSHFGDQMKANSERRKRAWKRLEAFKAQHPDVYARYVAKQQRRLR